MKLFIVLLLIVFSEIESQDTHLANVYSNPVYQNPCIDEQYAVQAFSNAFNLFNINLYKHIAIKGSYFFIVSSFSVWITLAAIAEGADQHMQQELFKLLNLPEDLCSRQKIYQIATTRMTSTKFVDFDYKRALIIDEGLQLNPYWYNLVTYNSLLQVSDAPIKRDPDTASKIINQIAYTPNIGYGNSVLLNSINYNGLWTTAFDDALIERSPFYDKAGQRIGSVDMMRMKKRVRVGYVKTFNAKTIELPVGINKEYSMVFALVVDTNNNLEATVLNVSAYTMNEVVGSLQESYLPIEVGIPRFLINTEIDVMEVLKDMGFANLWTDPLATRYISNPPAQPSSYIQRVTLSLNSQGFNPPPRPSESTTYPHSTDEEKYWGEFIADRPFLFALFDTQTYTCLLATIFTQPTYPL